MNRTWRMAANAAGFQLGWFACVLGAAHRMPLLGTAIAAGLIAIHLATALRPRRDLALVGLACVLGLAWDSSLAAAGLVRYAPGPWLPGLAPHWIVALWALFAATLDHSLGWLQRRPGLGALLGGIFGPLSFVAGVRLGAASLPSPTAALVAIGVGWALWVPLLAWAAARLPSPEARHA